MSGWVKLCGLSLTIEMNTSPQYEHFIYIINSEIQYTAQNIQILLLVCMLLIQPHEGLIWLSNLFAPVHCTDKFNVLRGWCIPFQVFTIRFIALIIIHILLHYTIAEHKTTSPTHLHLQIILKFYCFQHKNRHFNRIV